MANKKYYWLKLQHDFFHDLKIKKLRKTPGGDTSTIILLKIMLSTLHHNGILVYEGIEQTLAKELALKLDEDEANTQVVLIFMEKIQLIEEVDVGRYSLPDVIKNTGVESDSAERKRKQRAKEKSSKSVTLSHESHALVTSGHKNVTTEKEKENRDLSISIFSSPLSLSFSSSLSEKEKFESFVNHIRQTYKPNLDHNFYPTIVVIARNEKGVWGKLKVDNSGHLYFVNELGTNNINATEAEKLWRFLYEKHQNNIIPIEEQYKNSP